ncbi:MAG: isoprenylcysteine carboxylmethyltransferase family protein [Pseudomonadota bacterium]
MKRAVPPPLVFLAAIIATFLTKLAVPATRVDVPLIGNIGFAMVLLGGLLAFFAVARFRARGTTINPHHPERSTVLVTDGVFALTRNPMYLALALVAAGAALMQSAPLGLLFVAAAAWYITKFQIKPEEDALRVTFGADFNAYAQRVRRWI